MLHTTKGIAMSSAPRLGVGVAALLLSGACYAETIYRWVDKDGSVSFSSSPPPGMPKERLSEVEVEGGPPAERQQAAEERVRQIQDTADRMQQERTMAKMGGMERLAQAEDQVRQAQADLARAQVQTPEDWQTIAGGGGRYLKPNYYDRVRAAQEILARAQERLAKAQRDTR